MSKIIIEVADDNPFNEGWLLGMLGQPRPYALDPDDVDDGAIEPSRAVTDAMMRADGWDMANDTPDVRNVRRVFQPPNSSFIVSVKEPTKVKEPVTE